MINQMLKPLACSDDLIFVIPGAGVSASGEADDTCHSLYGGHMDEVLLL
jgi:shikimate kinase